MIAMRPAMARSAAQVTEELVLADLLHDLGELTHLLAHELEREGWLDAFLLAAGMNQVVEDYLHRDPASLAKVAANVGGPGGAAVGAVRRMAITARTAAHGERAVVAWQAYLAELVLWLARRVAGDATLELDWHGVLEQTARLSPRLRSEILRLPSCFRSLDLLPEDMEGLADAFAARRPDRSAPLLVVGVRTSGSYLAPLQAAYLRQQGFASVAVRTLRPGSDLLSHERRELTQVARGRTVAIVVDDPPSSGRAVARTAELLQKIGFPRSRIVLSLPLSRAAPPEALAGLETVALERGAWAVEARLEATAVRSALNDMLPVASIESVRRVAVPPIEDPWEEAVDRRHVRALYEVDVRLPDGRLATRQVYAKGVGLGYYGRHSLAVARALPEYTPALYGVRDGLLFREWQPEAWRAGRVGSTDSVAERIAGYVHARGRALRAERDLSFRMVGRQAVWQRTADMLLEPFGRLRVLRRPSVHRLARRLLRVESPSVVDGSMGLHHWFVAPDSGAVAVKVDNDERAYSNEDIYSYDAAYDLGAAASSLRVQVGPESANTARWAYEQLAGARLEGERWLLYQLLSSQLHRQTLRHNLRAATPDKQAELIGLLDGVERALEDAQRDFMRNAFLSDVEVGRDGLVCAIDVDGTLETAPLGFTAIGPAGALALRALAKHGFRAVLASGRSLEEIRMRCDAYSLAAGVAEYGAVVYDATIDETVELLTEADRVKLGDLRSVLARTEGINLDGRYQRSVRAFSIDSRGRRRALPRETIDAALADASVGPAVVAVPGWSQTDFVSASVNKADGLRVAVDRIGSPSREPLVELAVGDAAADLPMFRVARRACVPAGGDIGLRRSGARFMSAYGQDGLAEAVASLIGHQPGGCRVCRWPEHGADTRLLLSLMGGYEKRGRNRLAAAMSFAWNVRQA